ncbi:phage tail tape measure protein [Spiractinospora alimapuensis]|uniref:phage tail tape measure protein n=1 Tax=Spiractinospora alimapuensis TaxID=2820884 RepID=UPI001F254005|nr:phage tail tape measure protein [Spiractinospora alimapuensis]QVQ51297.1 phage tail tape measure protein [Spiractinospora alimapuensis]
MATLQELLIRIGADVEGLEKIDRAAEGIEGKLGSVRSAGERVSSVGQTLTARVTTPIVGLGAAVLKTAGDFESSMNGVRAVTGATGSDFDQLTEQARDLGATTQFSATEAANGMEFLGMAGWDTTEIMSGLPDVLNLAAAGGLELASAADIASNIMSGFGIEASEAARVADVLAEASASSNTSVEQLGDGLSYAAPIASGLGISLEETAAAMGILGDAGIQGSRGGTAMRSALTSLTSPTGDAQSTLDALGVTVNDTDGNMRSLTDIFRDFEDAGADVNDMTAIFGQEAGPAMLAILERGADDLEAFTEQLEGSGGAAEEMADIRMEGLQGSLKELGSAAEALMLSIADSGLLEFATGLVEKLTGIVQGLSDTNPHLLKWGSIIAGVLAAVGPLLVVLGFIMQAIGHLAPLLKIIVPLFKLAAAAKMLFNVALWASPVTWIVIAIIALIAIIILCIVYWDDIKDAASRAWEWIKSATMTAVDAVVGFLAAAWEWIKSSAQAAWDWVVGIIQGAWDWAVSIVQGAVDWIVGLVQGWIDTIKLRVEMLKLIPKIVRLHFLTMYVRAREQGQRLLDFVRSIPDRIKKFFGSAGSWLRDAGKKVISGLVSGIQSMVGRVTGAMSSIAGTIRSYLPFSPAEIGPLSGSGAPEVSGARIAETLGEGVMSELRRIDAAADALMSPLDSRVAGMRDVARSIPANVNASVSRGGSGSTVTIDVTGADGEFKRLIRRMVRTDGRGDVQRAFGQ